jgi:tetratricopeptide (TPR) repeat protein
LTALLVAAASDSGEVSLIATAASQLGADAMALEAAEAAGLVRLGRLGLEFRHPLLRAAVYHGATPQARRDAHRALGAAFQQAGDADRAAWQLAAATIAADAEVAEALEQAGLRAQARGGHAAAARALERAAQLSLDPTGRAHRLHAAAKAYWFAGHLNNAILMLDQALPLAADPGQRADVQHLKGQIEAWRGNMSPAWQLLVTEGELAARANSEKAVLMLADACFPLGATGDHAKVLETARRAVALARGSRKAVQTYASMSLGMALVICGQANEGYPLILRTRNDLQHEDPSLLRSALAQQGSQTSVWVEDWERARSTLDEAISSARAQSAPERSFLITWDAVRSLTIGLVAGTRLLPRRPKEFVWQVRPANAAC